MPEGGGVAGLSLDSPLRLTSPASAGRQLQYTTTVTGCTCSSALEWSAVSGYAACNVIESQCPGGLPNDDQTAYFDFIPAGCIDNHGVGYVFACSCASNSCICSNSPCAGWPSTASCGAGKYVAGASSPGAQVWKCVTCPAGTFNPCTSCTNVLACPFCPKGTYSLASASSCTPCPANMTTYSEGATGPSSCYAVGGGSGSGQGGGSASSSSSTVLSPYPLLPGDDPSWVADYVNLKDPGSAVYWPGNESCPASYACIGHLIDFCPFSRRCLGNNTCDSNFLPPVCVRCPPNYYLHRSTSCRPCSGMMTPVVVESLFAAFLLLGLAAASLYSTRSAAGVLAFGSENAARRYHALKEKKDLLGDLVDRSLRLHAVSAIIRISSPIQWPPPFAWVISFGSVLSADTSVGLSCFGLSNWYGPAFTILALFAAWALYSLYVCRLWRSAGGKVDDDGENDDDASPLRMRIDRALGLSGVFCRLVVAGVLSNILNFGSFGKIYQPQDSTASQQQGSNLTFVTMVAGLSSVGILLINCVSECCPIRGRTAQPGEPCCPVLSATAKRKRCKRMGGAWLGSCVSFAFGAVSFLATIGAPGWVMMAILIFASSVYSMVMSCSCCTEEHLWGCCPCGASAKGEKDDGLWAVGPTQTWAGIFADLTMLSTTLVLLLADPLASQQEAPFQPRTLPFSAVRSWSLGFLNLFIYAFYALCTAILAFGGTAVSRVVVVCTIVAVLACAAVAAAF